MSITRMRKSFAHILRPLLLVIALIFFVGAILIIGMPSFVSPEEGGQRGSEHVAAVNGRKISRAEFADRFDQMRRMIESQGMNLSALQNAEVRSMALSQLIQMEMRLWAAEREGIRAGSGEVKREREKMIDEELERQRQIAGGERKKKLSDKEFNLILSRLNPPRSIRSFRKEIARDVTKEEVRDQLMLRKLEEHVKASVGPIDDKRLMESFRLNRVRQILINVGTVPDAQAKRKAEEIYKRIKAGEDFARLAREFSDDTLTKANGGDMDFIQTSYDKDLRNLKVGQVSPVHKWYQSYRIAKIEATKLELPKDFEKEKKKHRDQLKQNLEYQALGEFHQKNEESAKVEVYDPELKGYWLAERARMGMTAPEKRDKLMAEAVSSLLKAIKAQGKQPDPVPYCKLAQVYQIQGKVDEAIEQLVHVLDGAALTEGPDLRIMLAELYIQKGDNKGAKPHLELASEMAYNDVNIHRRLQGMYMQIGERELAAKEAKWLEEHPDTSAGLPAAPPPAR